MDKTFLEAIEAVYQKIIALSKEDFYKQIEAHANGDYAKILLETNALEVGEIKSKAFEDNEWEEISEGSLLQTIETSVSFSGRTYLRIGIAMPFFSGTEEASKVRVGIEEGYQWQQLAA